MDRRGFLKAGGLGVGGLLLASGAVGLLGRTGMTRDAGVVAIDGQTMGTGYSVRIAGSVPNGLTAAVQRALDTVEARFSTWRPESELSRFNASADTDWQPASDDMLRVAAGAHVQNRVTGGAFDPSVGPLVDLWGFGPSGGDVRSGRPRLAEPARVASLLAHVGRRHLELDLAGGRWRKRDASHRLDFSGIAKGDAVDRVAARLDAAGIEHWLVEVGGEVRARGQKPDGSAWRIGIERPELARRVPFRVVEPAGRALATSGDYRNYFDHGGRRYSHAIDPRSGQPVWHALASVSVAAPTAMEADALSTGLMILGPDAAMALAESRGIAAHFILRAADGRSANAATEERWSSAFEPLLVA